jgi:hypothetical protein
MPDQAKRPVLRAALVDDETGEETPLGRVAVGDAGELVLLEATAGHETFLANLLRDTNAKDAFRLKVPPPPEAEQFEVYSQLTRRTDPDILDAVRSYLETYYDVVLTPEG